jgi:hypothetical protein
MGDTELAKNIGKDKRDKEDMKQSLAPSGGHPSYLMFPQERIKVKNVNVVIKLSYANDDAFILGHATQGTLGTSRLGAGSSGIATEVEVLRREWTWTKYEELKNGTYSDNVTIVNGTIQLGR